VDANPVAKGNVLQPPAEQQTQISASIEKRRGSGFIQHLRDPWRKPEAFFVNKAFVSMRSVLVNATINLRERLPM
jgi:hypothetical protein